MIEIYTDGACSGNPGPGGYGVFIKPTMEVISGSDPRTTNNRMELMGAIVALESVMNDDDDIVVYSDSKYLCDAHNAGWLKAWTKNGFHKRGGGRVQNIDLWKRLLKAEQYRNVKYVWIKGHAGHPENEACDRMAVEAYKQYL